MSYFLDPNEYSDGTEAPGGGNESPDENDVDEIGKALGESYKDTEPLDPTKKEKPSEY